MLRRTRNLLVLLLLATVSARLFGAPELPAADHDQIHHDISGATGDFIAMMTRMPDVDGISRFAVEFPSPVVSDYPENNRVIGEVFLPAAGAQRGAPLVLLHILNGNFTLERLVALEMAQAGVPSFWFKLPFYGDRRPQSFSSSRPIDPVQLMQLIDQGSVDFRRACDFMALWQTDPSGTVNVAGISMGGILSFYFASIEPRIGKISSIMAGGDLWGIIQTANETRQLRDTFTTLDADTQRLVRQELSRRDPLEVAPRLRPKAEAGKILMINAAEDEVIPRIHAEQLGDALGIREEIVWMEGVGHYSMAARLGEIIDLLAEFLTHPSADPVSPAPTATPAADEPDSVILTRFLVHAGQLISPSAAIREAQVLDLKFSWQPENGAARSGSLQWKRAGDARHALHFRSPEWGSFAFGQSEQPWVFLEPLNTLLLGEEAVDGSPLIGDAGNSLRLKLQLFSNLLQYGLRVPGLLEEFGSLESDRTADQTRITYNLKRRPIQITLDYEPATQRYTGCVIKIDNDILTIDIATMKTETAARPSHFAPPPARETLPVTSLYLRHTLALLLQIADDKITFGRM